MESTYFSIFMFRNTVEPLFRGALIGLKSAPFFFNEGSEYKGLSSFFCCRCWLQAEWKICVLEEKCLPISPKEVTLDYEGFSFRGLIIVIGRSGDQFGL